MYSTTSSINLYIPNENQILQLNSTQKNVLFHSLSISSSDFNSGIVSRQKEIIEVIITAIDIKAQILAARLESGYSISSQIFLITLLVGIFGSGGF